VKIDVKKKSLDLENTLDICFGLNSSAADVSTSAFLFLSALSPMTLQLAEKTRNE
jgi:hypothetical protein